MREVEEEKEEQGGEGQRRLWGNREASRQGRKQSRGFLLDAWSLVA